MSTVHTGTARGLESSRAWNRMTYRLLITIVFLPCLIAACLERASGDGRRADVRSGRKASVLETARSHAHAAVGYAFQP